MMFHRMRRMAALFALMTWALACPVIAQTPVKTPVKTPIPVVKQSDLARVDRRPSKTGRSEGFSGEKKKAKNFSYSYLLPFGVGQFERDKTILGTTLATAQAGFLLMYYERSNAVRTSNADAADVMRGVNTATAGSDPAIVAFLDQNEKFTLQAQQQASMALLGFFALYTAGVVEAVFDPFSTLGSGKGGSKKKKKEREMDFSESPKTETPREDASALAQELREEERSKIGVFVAPTPKGSGPTVGLSIQKPF
ncbi:MAG TPA: hypothetical protein VFO10_21525 [Oligoflexus sp.]|uniref:hypothetical protein n=1 Tax=Oligoflexus sp. TaxID=1971216 RepID=UPI002D7F6F0D|nr:hypothetical protein [Oligoflexus sp.]HET9239856.1 hypothetical protein [Oligoflexus sp.]